MHALSSCTVNNSSYQILVCRLALYIYMQSVCVCRAARYADNQTLHPYVQ